MKKFIYVVALIAVQQSYASHTEFWEGSGAMLDLRGKETGNYKLIVKNTKDGSQIQSDITVTLTDGTTQEHQCLSKKKDERNEMGV